MRWSPIRRPSYERGSPGLAELEPEQHLVVVAQLAGPLEAVALVEADRAALALTGARAQRLDSRPDTEVLDEQVERRRGEALPLVALVDEELPEVVRHVVGTCDVVGDHHEPDRRVV